MSTITFLSDFGLRDEWVGVCKGVLKRIAPEADIIDLSHEVPSYNVREGAFLLFASVSYLPVSVHLAVVDPGVGSERRALIIEAGRGDLLVGPDNGLLTPTATRLGGITKAVVIENDKYLLTPLSFTFHGRDIFSPVAAYLAAGVPIEEFGPKIKPVFLAGCPWPEPVRFADRIECEAIHVDRFGSLRLNLPSERSGLAPGKKFTLNTDQRRNWALTFEKTFSDVPPGQLLLFNDSSGVVAIGVNQGSAAEMLQLKAGDNIIIYLK